MADSNSKDKKKSKKQSSWPLRVFLLAVALSAVMSFFSSTALEGAGYMVTLLVLAVFIALGIMFDMVGVAVTAGRTPSRSTPWPPTRKRADGRLSELSQNANQVSSVCNDVVGDICGIVSGSTAAVIVVPSCSGI